MGRMSILSVRDMLIQETNLIHLFVGKYQQNSVSQLVFLKHTMQFVASFADSLSVIAVDYKNEALGILEVVSPQRSNLVLATDVPYGEAYILVLYCFNVET